MSKSATTTKSVEITPKAGFCIKSTTIHEEFYGAIGKSVPASTKVFINICYHDAIPQPPTDSEDQNGHKADFVPLILSDGREETDKSGKPALTFDAIFHPSVKSKVLRSQDFKVFLVEVTLQQMEASTPFVFSRSIGTPNIASKGKLTKRSVRIPAVPADAGTAVSSMAKAKHAPLIEEVSPPKGILKTNNNTGSKGVLKNKQHVFTWSWTKLDSGVLQIAICVPNMTHDQISKTTLDLEPQRLILTIPALPNSLDINLNKSDAEIVSTSSGSGYLAPENGKTEGEGDEVQQTLLLKRQRALDVEKATAEWRVKEGKLVVFA